MDTQVCLVRMPDGCVRFVFLDRERTTLATSESHPSVGAATLALLRLTRSIGDIDVEFEEGLEADDTLVPPDLTGRETKVGLMAIAMLHAIPWYPPITKADLCGILDEFRRARAAEALEDAHEVGLDVASDVPEGLPCGFGEVHVRAPDCARAVIDAPFGQDYERNCAYVSAVVRTLTARGISARAVTRLD